MTTSPPHRPNPPNSAPPQPTPAHPGPPTPAHLTSWHPIPLHPVPLRQVDVLPLALGIEDHSITYNMATEQELEEVEEAGRVGVGNINGGNGGGGGGGGEPMTSGAFEVVLSKGMKLPATELRTFQCEDPSQKGVTIELFGTLTSDTNIFI